MRLLLTILAAFGLLISPVHALAAQAACERAEHAAMSGMHMADMDMAGMDAAAMVGMDHAAMAGPDSPPCCDPDLAKGGGDKSCVSACVTMCGVTAALPAPAAAAPAVPMRASLVIPPTTWPLAHEQPAPKRPPRPIA